MENIENGLITIGNALHYTSEGEPKGPLIPQNLFKSEAEAGIGETFMGKDENGEPCPMIKVDKQYFEDFEKIWYGEH